MAGIKTIFNHYFAPHLSKLIRFDHWNSLSNLSLSFLSFICFSHSAFNNFLFNKKIIINISNIVLYLLVRYGFVSQSLLLADESIIGSLQIHEVTISLLDFVRHAVIGLHGHLHR